MATLSDVCAGKFHFLDALFIAEKDDSVSFLLSRLLSLSLVVKGEDY